jgi:hypothetical protein
MRHQRRKPPADTGLKKPVKKFDDTFSGEDVVLNWLKEQGATESRTFDEETGEPMRTFTIKL